VLTSEECFAKYGDPAEEHNMTVWSVPPALVKGLLPSKIYCNRDMLVPLLAAFKNIIDRDLVYAWHTMDGCFCLREKRSGKSMSLHSWGVAIDINAATNKMGQKSSQVKAFVQCFKDAGFDWGGDWSGANIDAMHFQLKAIK
jgi:hypothetical protein